MNIEQIVYLQHLPNWIIIPSIILLAISVLSAVLLWGTMDKEYDDPEEYARKKIWAIIVIIFACLCLIATVIGIVMKANASYMYDLWKYNHPYLVPIG